MIAQDNTIVQREVLLSRDSVAAGDDLDSHNRIVRFDVVDVTDLISQILKSDYLPSISGDKATWVAVSHEPIAVCAQEWSAPIMLGWRAVPLGALAQDAGKARIHFSYLAQLDPDFALNVLKRCAFKAA